MATTSFPRHYLGAAPSFEDRLSEDETRHAPLFGFAVATFISVWLWAVVAVAVWVAVR